MESPRNPWVRRAGFAALVLAAFLLGLALRGGSPTGDTPGAGNEAAENALWTCSMHPQIQMPRPGQCPICGMDLIPLDTGGGEEGPGTLTLSAAARKIAEIRTAPVARKSVTTTLRMVGKLEADETRVREITAWVSGRIDRLFIDYTGVHVDQGEKLFDLYSPELYSAQEELIQAIRASHQLSQSALESTRVSASRTVEAVRERLRLWGLTDAQIEEVERRGVPSDHVTIVAPISGVVLHKGAVEGTYVQTGTHVYDIADLSVLWLKLDVYESDLAWMEPGLEVEFETVAFPGEWFRGAVAFIDPMVNERSRSIKVRVNVENPDRRLKPGMFARAVVRAAVDGSGPGLPLVIPASAPLVTGKRAVVYVEDPERPGRFQGREVVLGPRAGDYYVVREGLSEKERVVTNGSFKIDSALQIQAKTSMMNPPDAGIVPVPDVPAEFRAEMDSVLAVYFQVANALSHDRFADAVAAAREFPSALAGIDHSRLPPPDRAKWVQTAGEIRDASVAIAKAEDIQAARRAFYDLSARMIATVKAYGTSGRTPVIVFNCPMARDGAGADWLQPMPGTENPYYGSRMFSCGSRIETLAESPADTAGGGHPNH